MSVAYRRWDQLGAGARGIGFKKIKGASQVHQYAGSEVSAPVSIRQVQQQQQQQQHPHEPCNLSSFSMYMHQYPSTATTTTTTTTTGGDTKIHIPATVKAASSTYPQKLSVNWETQTDASKSIAMATGSPTTLTLQDPKERAEAERKRWVGMMKGAPVGTHKPATYVNLKVPQQYYGTQGPGWSLMHMEPKELLMTTADCSTTSPDLLQIKAADIDNTMRISLQQPQKVVVDDKQCLKEEGAFSPSHCYSSSASSSIFDGRDTNNSSGWSSEDTACGGDIQEEEAQSAYSGPLDHMSALESSLPIKRPGLSKFFGGKARSFSSLADASIVSDLEKPNNPYARRRRMGINGSFDRPKSYPRLSRASLAGISKKTTNRSNLTVAIRLGGLTEEEEKDYVAALPGSSRIHWTKTIPSRSFSLTDLPVVGRHLSPPFRRSFAQP